MLQAGAKPATPAADAKAGVISGKDLTWVMSFSSKFPELQKAKGSIKDGTWHGSGHKPHDAAPSTTGFLLMSTVFMALSVFYMMWRVYK